MRGDLLALGVAVASAYATPILTGAVADMGQLTGPQNLRSGHTQGPNVDVYLEQSLLTLSSDLNVNRIGPDFGTFSNSGSGNGVIASGTTIIDYLLHYDHGGTSGNNDAFGSITFDSPIIGLIIFSGALKIPIQFLGLAE